MGLKHWFERYECSNPECDVKIDVLCESWGSCHQGWLPFCGKCKNKLKKVDNDRI